MSDEHLLIPAADCTPPNFRHSTWGAPVAVWPYHNENTDLLGFITRYNAPEGKQILPYTLWSTVKAPDGEWLRKSWPVPRPLYGLDMLACYPTAGVVICEGEKAADAAKKLLLFPDYICITSPGGSNAAHKADWSLVKNRKIIIWPDNDEAGAKYAQAVAEILRPHNQVTLLTAPANKPSGWDAADALAEGWHYA